MRLVVSVASEALVALEMNPSPRKLCQAVGDSQAKAGESQRGVEDVSSNEIENDVYSEVFESLHLYYSYDQ